VRRAQRIACRNACVARKRRPCSALRPPGIVRKFVASRSAVASISASRYAAHFVLCAYVLLVACCFSHLSNAGLPQWRLRQLPALRPSHLPLWKNKCVVICHPLSLSHLTLLLRGAEATLPCSQDIPTCHDSCDKVENCPSLCGCLSLSLLISISLSLSISLHLSPLLSSPLLSSPLLSSPLFLSSPLLSCFSSLSAHRYAATGLPAPPVCPQMPSRTVRCVPASGREDV
jgi:hypothetical protein